jgi:hypothetical protein
VAAAAEIAGSNCGLNYERALTQRPFFIGGQHSPTRKTGGDDPRPNCVVVYQR